MKKYFGYIRVSTTKQGEQGSSLQEQRSAIEAYAQRHGLNIVEWFEEQETAAAQGRPVFGRMLKAIERKTADGVITHKIDRSARNLKDWAHIGDLVERGVEMHFAHESLDLTSRSGRLSADILAVVASDYIRNLRDEIRKGFYGRLKQGLYPLPAPLGYLDEGKGKAKAIDPERGPLVRQAFELYASGRWTFEMLGHELHLRGLRNRGGGRVTHTGLSTILNNPFYIGIIKLRRTGEVFQGVHEPLIEPGTFSAVADVLAGRIPRRGYHKRFRYQKMLRCADCGYALTAERQRGHVYYRCHTRHCSRPSVRETEIEKQLVRLAEAVLLTDTEWETVRCDVDTILVNIPDQTPLRRRDLGIRLAATEERMKRLTDAFIDNVIERETFMTRKEQLLHEQADLRAAIGGLSQAEGSPRRHAEKMFEHLQSLSSLAESVSDEKLREILVDATSNIAIRSKELEITWQNPFNQLLSKPAVISGAPRSRRLRTKALAEDIAKIAIEMAEEHQREFNEHYKKLMAQPPSGADYGSIPYDLAA